MKLTIYHNPRCSKSRKTLAILRERGLEPRIVEYLKKPPDAATTRRLARMLGVQVTDLLRRSEAEFTGANDLPSLDDQTALADWLEDHPAVLQRPIVVDDERQRAVIGRPPENVLKLLAGISRETGEDQ